MKGLLFPLVVNANGGVDYSTDIRELVSTNLKAIFSWAYGDRFFLPEFGSRLYELLDTEPNDDVLIGMLPSLLGEPITTFEPRIKILDLQIQRRTDEMVQVYISYLITEANLPGSFQYPFYTNPKA